MFDVRHSEFGTILGFLVNQNPCGIRDVSEHRTFNRLSIAFSIAADDVGMVIEAFPGRTGGGDGPDAGAENKITLFLKHDQGLFIP